MKWIILAALSVLPVPVVAADWAVHDGDVPLTRAELQALGGQSLIFFDDGESRYFTGGGYSYTYSAKNGGATAFGDYRIADDGSICVLYRNGLSRCDYLVHSAARLVLIDEKGDRYPVRSAVKH